MDLTAFLALVERCAPEAPTQPLAAMVGEASGFEPLAIRADGERPVIVQGTSRADAIELATEFVIAGYRVQVGLAQIDTRDLDALGFSLAEGSTLAPTSRLQPSCSRPIPQSSWRAEALARTSSQRETRRGAA